MTRDELLLLVKAGYTKEEINALTQESSKEITEEPAEIIEEKTEEIKMPEIKKPEIYEKSKTPLSEENVEYIKKLQTEFNNMTNEISKLVSGIQTMNLKNARQAEPDHNNVDEILKNMLNPSK